MSISLLEPLSANPLSALESYVGGLSSPSKMPGYSYSLPARECITGAKLRAVKGSTCSGCYALKNRYLFPATQAALYRRLDAIGRPLWAEVMAELVNRRALESPYFRWHDSGDLQSLEHFAAICRVARLTPTVSHWLPTREYRIVADYRRAGRPIPRNLTVRMSAHMVGGTVPRFPAPLTVSTVSLDESTYPKAHHCPSRFQDNKCGECRACWSKGVKHVDYHAH